MSRRHRSPRSPDPSIYYQLIQTMMSALYTKPERSLKTELMSFIDHNSRLCGNTQTGMSYRGEFFDYAEIPARGDLINVLQPAIRTEFKVWLQRRKALDEEKETIRGFLQQLLVFTHSVSDMELLLPENLMGVVRKVLAEHPTVPSVLGQEQVDAFQQTYQRHLDVITRRTTYNMLDVAAV